MDDILKYYEILGLKPGATEEQIKQAYRDLAKVWHPDRFQNDPRLQEKAQEKIKEINLAYDYLKYHRYVPPPDDESPYTEQEECYKEEKSAEEESMKCEEPMPTYTSTSKYISFFSRIPKWVTIVVAIILIRGLINYLNTPSKPQKTDYKPPLYYPIPSKPFSPVIEPIPPIEKQKLQNPIAKPPPKTSKVNPKYKQDEALKETKEPSLTSEEKYNEILSQSPDKVVLLPSPKHSVFHDYFTIGSSKEEVLAVQGTPSSIIGETWHYGYSSVKFVNGRVKGYSNISKNLHVKLSPKVDSSLEYHRGYFTIGSGQEEVLAAQGTPSSIIGNTWYYDYSSVEFVNDRVRGYSNISRNLRVKLLPKTESSLQSPDYFTIGSTQDEVLAVQGTPTSIIGNTWHYDYSSVEFVNGRVRGYSNISKNLKVRLQ